MKTNLARIAVLWLPLLSLFLASCEQDAYEKGEGKYSMMRADFVEVHADGDKQLDYALTDDGDSLRIASPVTYRWVATPDSLYRALLYYNKLESGAEAIACAQVPTAFVHREAEFDGGVRQDPVNFESAWVSRNGRYINFAIILKSGSTDAEDALHHLGVVGDTIVQNADGTRTYHLRLYHDQGDVPQYYSQHTYFSVPLQPYDVDSMRMTIRTYDGDVVRTLCTKSVVQ